MVVASKRLTLVVADFLDALAAGRSVEIGEFGPAEQYTKSERSKVGPQVGSLHRAGAIAPAGGQKSVRVHRGCTFTQIWCAVDRARCADLARQNRELAARMDEDGGFIDGPKQLDLFEVAS